MKYLMGFLPKVARKLSSNPVAYIYLAQSIQAWPNQALLAEKISQAGWKKVTWKNLTFGIVAIHIGYKESK
jgi:demethylmenaquinone methyltransferase/2-methoxy-6-polyprenyl-1,4-benzoquinol methylase